jgi:hypothetical protein
MDVMAHDQLEIAVLQMIFAGDEEVFRALREQVSVLGLERRDFSGVGFYTTFSVGEGGSYVRAQVARARVGDVAARIRGLRFDAGFVCLARLCHSPPR